MADVFISYKREELAIATRVAMALEDEGYSTFHDLGDDGIHAGESWDKRLEQELARAKCCVVLWSPQSVGSNNVRSEARRADQRNILVPAIIGDCQVPLGLDALQAADLAGWSGERAHPQWRFLVDRGIARKVGRKAKEVTTPLDAPPPEIKATNVDADFRPGQRANSGLIGQTKAGRNSNKLKLQRWRIPAMIGGAMALMVVLTNLFGNHLGPEAEAPVEVKPPSGVPAISAPSSPALTGSEPVTAAAPISPAPPELSKTAPDPIAPATPAEQPVSSIVEPEMVRIPGGKFQMGSPETEAKRNEDEKQHWVNVPSFMAGKYEVTFEEWDACVADGACGGYTPSDNGWGRGKRPVINVSWDDAQSYLKWLRGKTGKSYRLLTESEWEYAARAGTITAYWWGETFDGTKADAEKPKFKTDTVGSYPKNQFGLYDTAGNVSEWVQDHYHWDYAMAPTNGSATEFKTVADRIHRGGAWLGSPRDFRSGSRAAGTQASRVSSIGFRIARTL